MNSDNFDKKFDNLLEEFNERFDESFVFDKEYLYEQVDQINQITDPNEKIIQLIYLISGELYSLQRIRSEQLIRFMLNKFLNADNHLDS